MVECYHMHTGNALKIRDKLNTNILEVFCYSRDKTTSTLAKKKLVYKPVCMLPHVCFFMYIFKLQHLHNCQTALKTAKNK